MAAVSRIGNGDGAEPTMMIVRLSWRRIVGSSRECSVVAVVGGGRGGVADVDRCSVGSRTVKRFASPHQTLTTLDEN